MTRRRVERRASWTAQSIAAGRAAEAAQPSDRRLLDDSYAHYFVHDVVLRACLAHPLASRAYIGVINRVFRGVHVYTVLRARYTDDMWAAAIESGLDQLVVLGAGFDTISLRTTAHVPVTIFEVDAPATQERKRVVFDRLRASDLSRQIIWVPCDFENDSLQQRLVVSGFDPTRRGLVVWAGVTAYLTRRAIERTLADLAAVCAPGSRLLLDYIDVDVVSGHPRSAGARRAAGLAALRGERFRTGLTPTEVDDLLTTYGFQCCRHICLPELLQRYAPGHLRWPSGGDWQTIATATRK